MSNYSFDSVYLEHDASGTNFGTGNPGGGSGEYVEFVVNNPAGSYIYTVGLGGVASAGAGSGATGVICVEEFYS